MKKIATWSYYEPFFWRGEGGGIHKKRSSVLVGYELKGKSVRLYSIAQRPGRVSKLAW